MKKVVTLASLLLATALIVSLCLPWFRLPVLGWTVPFPGWNEAGLACLVLAGTLTVRAVGGQAVRWLVRIALLPSFYFWWHSLSTVKRLGAEYLAPAQLKLSSANQALARLGVEGVTLYEPALWRTLEPVYGWYVTGGVLMLALCLTLLDRPVTRVCPACQSKAKAEDLFCFSCGEALLNKPVCRNCGGEPEAGDAFCRDCGGNLA